MEKETRKKLLKPFLFPLAVAIVAWEEFIYKPIQYISNYFEKNKIIHKISEKIRHANPYIALGILICGGLPLIPFKMAGLYLVGHGYALLGIGTFGLAKVVGGAITVQLFNLTEPAIRKISFVNTVLNWTFDKKNKIKKVLTDSEHYQSVQNTVKQFKIDVKELILNNTYIQKIKQKFSHTSSVEFKPISKEVIEVTMVERITSKMEDMSHTVSIMIDETVVVSSHSIKEVVKNDAENHHFEIEPLSSLDISESIKEKINETKNKPRIK